ncbi:MAG: Ig-like domain-containing protein [Dysgonamonadaceae bacterium]|jgi:uncharacterized protein (DUF2141 family)|nr:Ig-like domain-containing protein [Dysgonamonadaceae bacterium]
MQLIRRLEQIVSFILLGLLILCGFYACASIGSPSGGAYDLTPPQMIASKPEPNTIRFTGHKIELLFDEYISLEKPSEKVIITPPQQQAPVIKAIGRKITVELKDSLLPNTTYTFDFTDAIVDNNEKNAIEGFTYAFSTGDVVDSLIVSGILLNAENLEPMPNIMVGLHVNLDDSAFTSLPFLRTSRTNDRGRFWIRNVSPGTYHVFALNDQNRNYRFDQPEEAIAFDDSLIIPSFEPAVRADTIWKDSLTVDSIRTVHYNRFTPDDVTLFLFTEDFQLQYFTKSERVNEKQFSLHFNSSQGLPPKLRLLDADAPENWVIPERAPDLKSLTYWIVDSTVYQRDTLKIEMNYLATDSLHSLSSRTDTLQLTLKKKAPPKKDAKPEFLTIQVTPSGMIDVFDTLKITFSEPVLSFPDEWIRFEHKVDTLWKKQDFPLMQDSLNPQLWRVDHKWTYGQEYRLTVDSAALQSIYGKTNNELSLKFKTQIEEEYGNLYVAIEGINGKGFGELLNSSDKVVRISQLIDGELIFEDLKPAKYYLRYIDDTNGNGHWDTGNYTEKYPPERVYYYHGFFEIRKYSDIEQTWNVTEVPVEKQKPVDITKNKPVVKKPKRDEQNSNQPKNNTSPVSRAGMPGIP